MQDLEKTRPLSPKEEHECALKAREGDAEALDLLVRSNLRFVVSIAKMYTNDAVQLQELIQAGNIGLMTAASNFDPTRGFKFISYAVFHIRNEIILELTNNSRMVRMPSNKVQLVSKVKKAQSLLYSRLGREASEEEIIDFLQGQTPLASSLTPEVLRRMLIGDLKTASIDRKIDAEDGGSSTLGDFLPAEEEDPGFKLDQEYRMSVLEDMMRDLNQIDKEILLEYFGINEVRLQRSSTEIGKMYGLSSETVLNRIRKAIARMKLSARKRGINLEDFEIN